MEITCGKRKMGSYSFGNSKRPKTGDDGNGEKLCKDVLESIFQRLNFVDLARARLVCSDWHSVSKVVENSYAQSHPVPWLLVPDQKSFCLFNPEEKKSFNMKTGFDFSRDSCYVVGSSHGCLIYLDEDLMPVVLNPLTGSRIQLPRLIHNDCIVAQNSINGDYIYKQYLSHTCSTLAYDVLAHHWLRAHIMHKVILSSNPFNTGKNCSVALIYGPDLELAYFNIGDRSWTRLDQDTKHYSDIIFHENKLFAVEGTFSHVEIWDFSGNSPKKLMKLEMSIPAKLWSKSYFFEHSDCWRLYLVESSGKILLVARQIADYVDGNGNVVIDPDLEPNETNHPPVFPYGTISFYVFELDILKQQWVEVKLLDGFALFLGGNHSLSVSTQQDSARCEDNCIYFTDDNWRRMDEDYMYGGHDRGVFSMNDGKVRMFDDFGCDRIQPSPCWFVPKPW